MKKGNGTQVVTTNGKPIPVKSMRGALRGVRTAQDLIDISLALGSDAIIGALPPQQIRAAVGAYGLALRTVDTVHRFGRKAKGGTRALALTSRMR